LPELEKIVKSRINNIFNQKFRDFVNTLSDTVASYSLLAKSIGFGQTYQNFSNWCANINRHYILDLIPEVSIVRNLLKQGFDIYATDWGTPSAYDKDLTIGHFVKSYMDKSVDLIRETTKSDKVSLLGTAGDEIL
jgi:hypothetical protein